MLPREEVERAIPQKGGGPRLRPIYTAPNVEAAELALDIFEGSWGARFPMIVDSWRVRWENITPFLSLPADLRRIV